MVALSIREYGSALYAGLACAVPPTNTNFQSLLLLTQADMPYINTHKPRRSYFKFTLTFTGPAKRWKCLSAARQKRQILANFQHNNQRSLFRVGMHNSTHQYKLPVTFLLTRLWEALYEDLAVQSTKFDVYHHFPGLCFIVEVNFWRP